MMKINKSLALGLILPSLGLVTVQAAPNAEVSELNLEELMDVKIYSAAKKEQALSETAAAAFVISQEDIRRSGATNVPDALRMAPGVEVAQINANSWAISIRGYNDQFSNKLLVLVDGRTVYSPLFAGTYWNAQDTVLEDIDRIEVIRGPGGTVWGANAVNGVINIRTKHSKKTQGGLVSAQGGNYQNGGSVRYGGDLGENGSYRVYAKGRQNTAYSNDNGQNAHDQWDTGQGGFRADYNLTGKDELSLSGDIQEMGGSGIIAGGTGAGIISDVSQRNANATAKLTHKTEDGEWYLQSYFLTDERRVISSSYLIDTFDMEFQHNLQAGKLNAVTWGLDYRLIADKMFGFNGVSFTPDNRETQLFSAFLQDQFSITDNLKLTVGSKIEHNDYSGFEYQPNARLLWKLNENHSTWTSVSRAVRTPSRSHENVTIDLYSIPARGPIPVTQGAIVGDAGVTAEEVTAFEWGYRGQMSQKLSFDVATFYNIYDNLVSKYPKTVTSPGLIRNLSVMSNGLEGTSYGAELYANWKVTDNWRLQPGYTWLTVDNRTQSYSNDTAQVLKDEGSNPQNQYSIRSQLNLPHHLEFDTSVYYVDNLRAPTVTVPNYTRVDLRLGWKPFKALELSVAGQNLLDNSHPEFVASGMVASQIPRSVYGKAVVTW